MLSVRAGRQGRRAAGAPPGVVFSLAYYVVALAWARASRRSQNLCPPKAGGELQAHCGNLFQVVGLETVSVSPSVTAPFGPIPMSTVLSVLEAREKHCRWLANRYRFASTSSAWRSSAARGF